MTNFSFNFLKETCVNVETEIHHESTNNLKFSKHPQLFCLGPFLQKFASGDFSKKEYIGQTLKERQSWDPLNKHYFEHFDKKM